MNDLFDDFQILHNRAEICKLAVHLFSCRLRTRGMSDNSYFGDIVLFTGLAFLTLHFSMLFIPFVMAVNFIFFIIPRLDNYLSAKYGKEFVEYAGRTKKFMPGVY